MKENYLNSITELDFRSQDLRKEGFHAVNPVEIRTEEHDR